MEYIFCAQSLSSNSHVWRIVTLLHKLLTENDTRLSHTRTRGWRSVNVLSLTSIISTCLKSVKKKSEESLSEFCRVRVGPLTMSQVISVGLQTRCRRLQVAAGRRRQQQEAGRSCGDWFLEAGHQPNLQENLNFCRVRPSEQLRVAVEEALNTREPWKASGE